MGVHWAGTFAGGVWLEAEDEVTPPPAGGPSLSVVVHDSDVVILSVEPAFVGTGVAYLHQTIRTYFEEDDSPPTDRDAGVAGLSAWLETHWPPAAALEDLAEVVDSYVVGDDAFPGDDDEPFAETTLLAFLDAVKIPRPPTL